MNATPLLISARMPVGQDALVLGAHLKACQRAQGRTFAIRCMGESVHAALGARLVTTVAGVASVMLLLCAMV